jgi:hypothetical protein
VESVGEEEGAEAEAGAEEEEADDPTGWQSARLLLPVWRLSTGEEASGAEEKGEEGGTVAVGTVRLTFTTGALILGGVLAVGEEGEADAVWRSPYCGMNPLRRRCMLRMRRISSRRTASSSSSSSEDMLKQGQERVWCACQKHQRAPRRDLNGYPAHSRRTSTNNSV